MPSEYCGETHTISCSSAFITALRHTYLGCTVIERIIRFKRIQSRSTKYIFSIPFSCAEETFRFGFYLLLFYILLYFFFTVMKTRCGICSTIFETLKISNPAPNVPRALTRMSRIAWICRGFNMDDKAFKTIGLLALNFLFSFTVSNYLSQEIDLVKSPITSLKIFCAAYCLGYFVLIITTARSFSTVAVPLQVQRFKESSIAISVFKWFTGVVIFHCLAVLYGASLSRYVEETFMWSVMMSDLVVLPCLLVDTEDIMKAILTRQRNINLAWCLCNIVVTLTVAGAWFGAFTLPLDWDRDWQVWPIPCAAGAMIGHLLSFLISGSLLYWKYRNKDKHKFI